MVSVNTSLNTSLLLFKTFMKKPWVSISVVATSLMWVVKPAVSAELCIDTLPNTLPDFEVTYRSGDLSSETAPSQIWAPPASLDAELNQLERLITMQGYEQAKTWLAPSTWITNHELDLTQWDLLSISINMLQSGFAKPHG
ncbi:MAG: hypothetical protein AAGC54_09650 [Cyanobacteria bacterium P01_F01_bin.4]